MIEAAVAMWVQEFRKLPKEMQLLKHDIVRGQVTEFQVGHLVLIQINPINDGWRIVRYHEDANAPSGMRLGTRDFEQSVAGIGLKQETTAAFEFLERNFESLKILKII